MFFTPFSLHTIKANLTIFSPVHISDIKRLEIELFYSYPIFQRSLFNAFVYPVSFIFPSVIDIFELVDDSYHFILSIHNAFVFLGNVLFGMIVIDQQMSYVISFVHVIQRL